MRWERVWRCGPRYVTMRRMSMFLAVLIAIIAFGGFTYWRKAQRARQIDLMDAKRTAMAQLRDGSGRRPDEH